MKMFLLISLVLGCAMMANACSSGGDGRVARGTGGSGAGAGAGGNSTGAGGGGTGGSAGGAAGGGGHTGSGGAAGGGGTTGTAGSGAAGADGARGGTGGGAVQACGTANPCAAGKVCVSYSCGPLGSILPGCTAPPSKCIDNPCDGGTCNSCPQALCLPFGGNCGRVDAVNIECIMPG